MTTTFTNRELPHIWVHQKQSQGKGSNMFFEDQRIYSYGRHFIIANLIKPDVVLFNSNGYSNTTAKHKTYVLRAIPSDFRVFTVPYPEGRHTANLDYYIEQSKELIEKAKRSTTKTSHFLGDAAFKIFEAKEYTSIFEVEYPTLTDIDPEDFYTQELRERIEKQEEKARTKKEREELQRAEKFIYIRENHVPAWQEGGNPHTVDTLPESYLRVNDGKVQTSHGATVSLVRAKVLFNSIQNGDDVRGFEIDGYKVVSLNGVLTVGCHKIERSEIERFAKTQKWI